MEATSEKELVVMYIRNGVEHVTPSSDLAWLRKTQGEPIIISESEYIDDEL